MSYRIYLGVVKKKKLNEYLARTEDDYFDFGNRDIELHDNLDIQRFSAIKEFKEDEYPPYVLTKDDLQYILDYYKKLNKDHYTEKYNTSRKEFEEDKTKAVGIHLMYNHIKLYFDELINKNINITDSGLFLLDYFYLVKVFDNLKDDECILITHG